MASQSPFSCAFFYHIAVPRGPVKTATMPWAMGRHIPKLFVCTVFFQFVSDFDIRISDVPLSSLSLLVATDTLSPSAIAPCSLEERFWSKKKRLDDWMRAVVATEISSPGWQMVSWCVLFAPSYPGAGP